MRIGRPKIYRGFTLLEVLVAMVILATTYAVVLQIFGGATRNASRIDDHRYALLLAESQLAKVLVDPRAELSGEFDGSFAWTTDYETVASLASVSNNTGFSPQLVTLTVSWGGGEAGNRQELSLSTVRLTRGGRP